MIISTGGANITQYKTSTVWIFNSQDEFIMRNGSSMTNRRAYHSCGIFYSDHHEGRPLLVVTSGVNGGEYWDFTTPGSRWELLSKIF